MEVRNFLLTTGSRQALVTNQSSIQFGCFFIRGKGDWTVKLYLNYVFVRVWSLSLRRCSTSLTFMQVTAVFSKLCHMKDKYVTEFKLTLRLLMSYIYI
jgi:hypothetical protein